MPQSVSNYSVLVLAGETLNDDGQSEVVDGVRWPKDERFEYLKDGLNAMFNLRPDLFFGQVASFDASLLTLDADSDQTYDAATDLFPLENRFRRIAADYVIMRCETKQNEAVNSGRAALEAEFFSRQLSD